MSTSTSGLLAGVQARPQSGSTPNLLGGRAASGSSLLSSAGASSLLSRRALPKKNLKVSTEKENAVPITRRIQKMNIPMKEMFSVLLDIHDGGDQCRIKRVKSKEDGHEYVMKIQLKRRIRGSNEAIFRRMTERMMNMPDSAHVVQVKACYEDSQYFYTLLEACDGGDLFDFFRMLMADDMTIDTLEREVRQVMGELLLSLDHMHKQGLVHKDVKLENLVFQKKGGVEPRSVTKEKATFTHAKGESPKSPSRLKLIDFDFTEEWEPDSPKSKAVVGTDGYIAPEAYLGDVCPKSDIFSAGVIMFLLVAGRFPYDDAIFDDEPNENYVGSPKMQEIHDKIEKFKVRFGKSWKHLDVAMDFCKSLIAFDVDQRPTAEEAMNHPWMAKFIDVSARRRSIERRAKEPRSPSPKSP
jgi:serine/threonine protein kinase